MEKQSNDNLPYQKTAGHTHFAGNNYDEKIDTENPNDKGDGGDDESKERTRSSSTRLDSIDLKLMDLIILGISSRECAKILNKPVSTIQRRARLLVQRGFLKPTIELRHNRLGLKKGFLHVYLEDGNVSEIVDKLLARDGIYSASAHLGNSDVIGMFVYRDSRDVLDLITWAKHQQGVERVVWSEEVYSKRANPKIEKIIKIDGEGRATIPMVDS